MGRYAVALPVADGNVRIASRHSSRGVAESACLRLRETLPEACIIKPYRATSPGEVLWPDQFDYAGFVGGNALSAWLSSPVARGEPK